MIILKILFVTLVVSAEEQDREDLDSGVTGCEVSTFGCCTNSSLPAHGPQEEGCCLQDAAGCCPDHVQVQDGLCDCLNSPLGCCPDGVTSRWSQEEDGCGCQHTSFGCCQDQYTAAKGRHR